MIRTTARHFGLDEYWWTTCSCIRRQILQMPQLCLKLGHTQLFGEKQAFDPASLRFHFTKIRDIAYEISIDVDRSHGAGQSASDTRQRHDGNPDDVRHVGGPAKPASWQNGHQKGHAQHHGEYMS